MPKYNNTDYIKLMRPIPKYWPIDEEGIPYIKKSDINISNLNNGLWLCSITNASIKDKNKSKKIIHCFKENKQLDNYYNKPYKFLENVGGYFACATFDYGMHPGMTRAQIIDATFKNRWSGVWMQSNGIKNIIVTVGWVYEDTYDICFSGIIDGSVLIISTLGCCNKEESSTFLKGYKEMRGRFSHSKIICYGNKIEGMDNDVCYVSYTLGFGNFDKYGGYYQPSLFNYDSMEVREDVI